MSKTVADEIVHVLETIGVQQIFGLIADSLNPLADSVRRSKIEWVGVRPVSYTHLTLPTNREV